jgi:hypothetical protein
MQSRRLSSLSAKRELLLFVVVYLFMQRVSTGQAPIEGILPEARAHATLPVDQRPLQSAPGAGQCQGDGYHSRFTPARGGRSLDVLWRECATLTRLLLCRYSGIFLTQPRRFDMLLP